MVYFQRSTISGTRITSLHRVCCVHPRSMIQADGTIFSQARRQSKQSNKTIKVCQHFHVNHNLVNDIVQVPCLRCLRLILSVCRDVEHVSSCTLKKTSSSHSLLVPTRGALQITLSSSWWGARIQTAAATRVRMGAVAKIVFGSLNRMVL